MPYRAFVIALTVTLISASGILAMGTGGGIGEWLALITFCLILFIFWYFAAYQYAALASSLTASRHLNAGAGPGPARSRAIAILYPTRNDFRAVAVEQLLNQSGAGETFQLTVYLLDDSTLPDYRQQVDDFARTRKGSLPDGVTLRVIRRKEHRGFKAGNLNHALRQIGDTHDFFAVCDSDGLFAPGFVERTLAAMEAGGPEIGFVQVRQEGRDAGTAAPPGSSAADVEALRLTWLADTMGYAVGGHFRHVVAARQRAGFVMFYGHGALIRTAAWRGAAGFPEIVTEDLAWSALIRRMGWRGIYLGESQCLEDYPPTYQQLRKRTEKWIRGTAEWLFLKGGGGFLHDKALPGTGRQGDTETEKRTENDSGNADDAARQAARTPAAAGRHAGDRERESATGKVPLVERLDVLTHAAQHVLALPMLLFLILTGFVLPAMFDQFRHTGNSFFLWPVAGGKPLVQQAMEIRYHVFWRWDFFLVMFLTIAAPLAPALVDLWRKPLRLYRYASTLTFLSLSTMVAETCAFLAFCCTGRAYFRNTFDAAEQRPLKERKGAGPGRGVNHPVVFAMEVIVGALFLWGGWTQKNLWLFGPAAALLCSPLAAKFGFENRFVRLVSGIPFLLMLLLGVMIGKQIFGLR